MRALLMALAIGAAAGGEPDTPAIAVGDGAAPVATVALIGPAEGGTPDAGDGGQDAPDDGGLRVAEDAAARQVVIMTAEVDEVRPAAVIKREPEVERPSFPRPAAGRMIAVAGGSFARGSAPDDALRDQFAENDLVETRMSPFEIDALPYPNDPDRPFLTGVTRPEADAACAEQGKRLCSELEWELACRGTDGRRYPTGQRYDPDDYPAADPVQPPSPLGVFAMGRLLEWTASQWGQDPDQVERAALRGFSALALTAGAAVPEPQGRRCAKRWHQVPDAAQPDLGFRCCRGKPNAEACFIERPRPSHSLYNNMKPDKFAQVIRSVPELYMVHDNPHMFSDADVRAVLARRGNDREKLAKEGVHFRWKPVRWIPRQGMELWVAVGRSDRHSFIVALHEVEDNDKYVHASSLILWNQPIPLALVYQRGHRDQLWWAPCWDCRDGGTVEFDDATNEVIITHKW
jgi:formylglycine-generating enzyme required for sulfatase activity